MIPLKIVPLISGRGFHSSALRPLWMHCIINLKTFPYDNRNWSLSYHWVTYRNVVLIPCWTCNVYTEISWNSFEIAFPVDTYINLTLVSEVLITFHFLGFLVRKEFNVNIWSLFTPMSYIQHGLWKKLKVLRGFYRDGRGEQTRNLSHCQHHMYRQNLTN